MLRQTIAKIVKQAAKTAGIAADLGTHAGSRSAITILWDDGDEALEDIAGFVGHARSATTAGYAKRRRRRPKVVSERAAALLERRPSDKDLTTDNPEPPARRSR